MTLRRKAFIEKAAHWILKAGYTAYFSVNGTCVHTADKTDFYLSVAFSMESLIPITFKMFFIMSNIT
jgi:hypothetical protein